MITQPNDIQKLIFAYEDDAYNRPQELAFITEAFLDTATLIPQKCGGGHLTHKNDCQMEQTIELMKELISTPIARQDKTRQAELLSQKFVQNN